MNDTSYVLSIFEEYCDKVEILPGNDSVEVKVRGKYFTELYTRVMLCGWTCLSIMSDENDNQVFFVEEYKKIQEAYKALNQSSILKNNNSSSKTTRLTRPESSSSSQSSGDFTVTISKDKIEELKNRTPSYDHKPHVKPSMFRNPFSFSGRIRRLEYGFCISCTKLGCHFCTKVFS